MHLLNWWPNWMNWVVFFVGFAFFVGAAPFGRWQDRRRKVKSLSRRRRLARLDGEAAQAVRNPTVAIVRFDSFRHLLSTAQFSMLFGLLYMTSFYRDPSWAFRSLAFLGGALFAFAAYRRFRTMGERAYFRDQLLAAEEQQQLAEPTLSVELDRPEDLDA